MRIIDGEHVDLISPFPPSEINRAVDWMYQHSSYVCDDSFTASKENIKQLLEVVFENQITYGIIDKNNLTKCTERVAPIVGLISFAMQSPQNGYIHIASARKAWGRRTGINLPEVASRLAINDLFTVLPSLGRISALMVSKNYAARKLAERSGFMLEGYMSKFYRINNKPVDAVHYGILRPEEKIDGPTSGAGDDREIS